MNAKKDPSIGNVELKVNSHSLFLYSVTTSILSAELTKNALLQTVNEIFMLFTFPKL